MREEYEIDYFRKYKNRYLFEKSDELKTKLSFWKNRLEKLNSMKNKGTLLDVGCSTGLFLKTAKDDGWDVKGVEISKKASKFAKETFGLDVFSGTLKDAQFPLCYFDVVTLWDVIEHMSDPTSVLLEVNRVLKKDGFIVIRTVNFRCLNQFIFKKNGDIIYYLSIYTIFHLCS